MMSCGANSVRYGARDVSAELITHLEASLARSCHTSTSAALASPVRNTKHVEKLGRCRISCNTRLQPEYVAPQSSAPADKGHWYNKVKPEQHQALCTPACTNGSQASVHD